MNDLTEQYIDESYPGLLHSNGAELPATGQEDIYDGLGNKSSLKLGRACNGATVCGELTVDDIVVTNTSSLMGLLLDLIHPVGSIFMNTAATNPGTTMGGTWQLVSEGRFLVGVGTGTDQNGVQKSFIPEDNAGEYVHTLTVAELAAHDHDIYFTNRSVSDDNTGGAAYPSASQRNLYSETTLNLGEYTESVGLNNAHNNTTPSYGVYIWKRTA